MSEREPQPLRRRVLAVVLGTVGALLLAELSLRLAGFVAYSSSGRGAFELTDSGLRVLCHGDSNVFGIYEPVEESYPGQLARILDERADGGPHTVVNLGVPGLGSRQLLSVIERDLERVRPHALVVTIGANDSWRWSPEAGAEYEEQPFWEEWRLVKVVRLFLHRQGRGRIDEGDRTAHGDMAVVEADDERGPVWAIENREGEEIRRFSGAVQTAHADEEDYWRLLREDLVRLHELAGDRLVLAAYGSDGNAYGEANAIFRSVAEERGIPLVDATADLSELSRRRGFGDVFWADLHPRGLGYEVIARAVYDELCALGVAEGEPFDDRLEGLRRRERQRPAIELVGSLEQGLALEIRDEEPGRAFRVVLWDAHTSEEPPPEKTYFEIREKDPLYRRSYRSELLAGHFDDEGRARVELDEFLGANAEARGTKLRAGYLVFADDEHQVLSRFSDGVVIELR